MGYLGILGGAAWYVTRKKVAANEVPSVSILSPATGSSFDMGSQITISGTLSDGLSITDAELVIDGYGIGSLLDFTITESTFSVTWITTEEDVGTSEIAVHFTYPSGVATSAPISLTIVFVYSQIPTDYPGLLGWWGSDSFTPRHTERTGFTGGIATGVTLTADQPDAFGGNTATLVSETAVTSKHDIQNPGTWSPLGPVNGDAEYDVYVKLIGSVARNIYVGNSSASAAVVVNPATGAMTNIAAYPYMFGGSVDDVGNGWFRIRGNYCYSGGVPGFCVGTTTGTTSAPNYLGDPSVGVLVCHGGYYSRQRGVLALVDKGPSANDLSFATYHPKVTPYSDGSSWIGQIAYGGNTTAVNMTAGVRDTVAGSFTWIARIQYHLANRAISTISATGATGSVNLSRSNTALSFVRITDAGATTTVTLPTPVAGVHVVALSYDAATGETLYYQDSADPVVGNAGIGTVTATAGKFNFEALRAQEYALYSGVLDRTTIETLQAGIVARNV